jgi:hypothetical protein
VNCGRHGRRPRPAGSSSPTAAFFARRGGALDGELAPARIYESLRGQPQFARAQDAALHAFPDETEVAAILRRSAELDETIAGMARTLPSPSLDLVVIYLPGLDIAQNALLGSSAGALAPSAVAARVDALRSYYPFLDRVLGPLVEPVEQRTLMLVTQPGRVQASSGGVFAVAPRTRDSAIGDMAMVNEPLRADGPRGSTPLDIAPTIWWRLGLPLSASSQASRRRSSSTPDRQPSIATCQLAGRPFVDSAPRTGSRSIRR